MIPAAVNMTELFIYGGISFVLLIVAFVVYFTHDDKKNFLDSVRDYRKDLDKVYEEIDRVFREDRKEEK